MTHKFYGLEAASWLPSDASPHESTLSGSFDPVFERCSMQTGGLANSTSYIETPVLATSAATWVRVDHYTDDVINWFEFGAIHLRNAATGNVARITMQMNTSSGLALKMYYWNGGWVQIGDGINLATATRHTIVWKVVEGASGSMALYVNGTLRDSGSAAMSLVTSVNRVRIYNPYYSSYWSQCIVADESLIGVNLFTREPAGAGANSEMTGTYADVDETVYSDVDRLISGTANQLSLFTPRTIDLTGYDVLGVGVGARSKRGATGPQNHQLAVRTNSNTYVSSTIADGEGYAPSINIWMTSPNTSVAWTAALAAAIQFGPKSIT